jgi:hypothetical protein
MDVEVFRPEVNTEYEPLTGVYYFRLRFAVTSGDFVCWYLVTCAPVHLPYFGK